MTHREAHRSHRSGWLRATMLGANDGIISTSSLIIGVTMANTAQSDIVLAGFAGLVAGAMSMAAGEFVSVSAQADTEKTDLDIERQSLAKDFESERIELAQIYEARGLTPELAVQVAEQLMSHDALGAHARDDIGITEAGMARPLQAALLSAVSFSAGALLPLLTAWWCALPNLTTMVALLSLFFLALLGAAGAHVGGAPMVGAAVRVTFWGALAMTFTALAGHWFGVVV